ncbi:calmodulin-A-like isoform X4 [Biomphalaria glabrata]|uniref:Calmodulin-A-like isoform X4 n=1 Tax=Biomphalaria glabrata TaxID=6526 RepID=A0A9W3AVP8_BIOGL|nr:calmodulin-A-like isoform X4 [Biomphalaria glabrata]
MCLFCFQNHAVTVLDKFTVSQIRELRQAFQLFDKDGDGSISTEELGTVMRNLGQFPSMDELNLMLREIDIDGDGTFSFEEFVQVMANVGGISENSEEDEEEELRQAFRVFDKSGCGYITPSDLRAVLQCMGEELTEEEIDEMIAEVDIDGDGRIDFEEFITCMRSDDEESTDEEDDEQEKETDLHESNLENDE